MPRELHRQLKERSKRNHRSLNSEVIACLEEAVTPKRIDPEEAVERIRAFGMRLPRRSSRASVRGPR